MTGGSDRIRPLVVLLNPASGSAEPAALERSIAEALAETGAEHRVLRAGRGDALDALARQATALARAADGAVVAAGGDGTLNAVAREALAAGVLFGALPQGTFNYFGRCHGLPEGDPAEGIRALADAREASVQVGLVNERPFLVNASLGLYPELLEQRERDTHRFGRRRWVALASGLRTLLGNAPGLRLSLRLDDRQRELHSTTLIVGNNRLQLEQLGVAEAARVGQGALVGLVAPALPRWKLFASAVHALLGRLDETPVESFAFTELKVAFRRRRRIKVAIDGEVVRLDAPLCFRIAPHRLRLLVPREAAA